MIKKLTAFLVITIMMLVLPTSVSAFGITPAEINVSNLRPGSRYESKIYVSRPPDEINESLTVSLETQLGEMEEWFEFVPGKEFDFPSGENVTSFDVVINVPRDINIDQIYEGRVTAKGLSDDRASEGVTIIKGAILGVALAAEDEDSAELRVLSIDAPDVNSGDPVSLLLNIQNLGNAAAAPDRVDLDVMDVFEKPIESLSDRSLEEIQAFSTKEISAEFNSNLEQGQYRVDASVIFQGNEIASEKMILNVNAKPAQVDEDVAVTYEATGWNSQTGILLAVMGLLLLVIILVLFLKKEKKTDSDFEKKLERLVHQNAVLTWFLVVASMVLIIGGLYMYMSTRTPVVEVRTEVPVDEVEVSPTEAMEEVSQDEETDEGESEENTEVMGAATEADDPLKIARPGTPGLYPVFDAPSFSAEIIYEAENGERFDANFLEDGWYRVVLEDGTQGWIHETSLKRQNQ